MSPATEASYYDMDEDEFLLSNLLPGEFHDESENKPPSTENHSDHSEPCPRAPSKPTDKEPTSKRRFASPLMRVHLLTLTFVYCAISQFVICHKMC